jgi:uridine kinase
MRTPMFIGIAGGTGSGKTAVARAIGNALGSDAVVIDHDAYYRDLAHLPFEARATTNFDHPDSLENELLCAHLDELRAGRGIDKPVYDFAHHVRSAQVERIEPAPVVLLEGILVLADPAIRERLDVRVFVDTDADVRILRRIRRDMEERGRSLRDVRDQYYRTVRPMHDAYVAPSRQFAHLIIPEGGENTVAIDVVVRSLMGAVAGRG